MRKSKAIFSATSPENRSRLCVFFYLKNQSCPLGENAPTSAGSDRNGVHLNGNRLDDRNTTVVVGGEKRMDSGRTSFPVTVFAVRRLPFFSVQTNCFRVSVNDVVGRLLMRSRYAIAVKNKRQK